MNKRNKKIIELASKGVSSKILVLLLSLGPLKLKHLQKILHPNSGGSSRISIARDDLLDLGLLEIKKVKIRPFKEIKVSKMADGIFAHRPIYAKNVTGIMAHVPTFKWFESPYKIRLNKNQRDFIRSIFRDYAFALSIHENNFSCRTGFDLYEIVKLGVQDQLVTQTVCSLFFGENYAKIIRQEVEYGKAEKLDDVQILTNLAKKCPAKLTNGNRFLFFTLLTRLDTISTKDLASLANFYSVKSEKDLEFIRHDSTNTFLEALKDNMAQAE